MKLFPTIILCLQVVLSLGALLIGLWLGMPWWSVAGTGIMLGGLMALEMFPTNNAKGQVCATYIGAVSGLGYLLFGDHDWESFYGIWSGLVLVPVFVAAVRPKSSSSARWVRLLTIVWALATDVIWLGVTYQNDQRAGFYSALFGVAALLVLSKAWFRLPSLAIQAVNTAILVTIGLPVANLFLSPKDSLGILPSLSEKPYSYSFYKKDPAAYARWWAYLGKEFGAPFQHLLIYETDGPMQYHLRPNAQTHICESQISINSKGFRGPEFPEDKKDAYRIVVLGESTTFGFTIATNEKPWPELLEKMIHDRLKISRPVEVINAGVPGYNINQNLYRLPKQILPLKPEMIISYHGYNGFFLVNRSLPPVVTTERPPVYQRRPIKLLADLEYGIKMNLYKKRLLTKTIPEVADAVGPMDSGYAQAYRQLIQVCRTNNIHLVLSTFSMSVNEHSDPDILQFYNATTMGLPQVLKANEVHNLIVKNLTESNADIGFVDTNPGIDGFNDNFVDTIHFSPEGEPKMAEAFFAGIKDYLVQTLAKPMSAH